MFYEGVTSGMSSYLAVGKFPRLAGADIVIINTPYGNYPIEYQKYITTFHQLTLPLYKLKQVFPAVGGGVHPGLVEQYINDLGVDIIFAVGGAIQGHPDGATAGVRAMQQAIEAVVNGISLEEAAKENNELKTALNFWIYK